MELENNTEIIENHEFDEYFMFLNDNFTKALNDLKSKNISEENITVVKLWFMIGLDDDLNWKFLKSWDSRSYLYLISARSQLDSDISWEYWQRWRDINSKHLDKKYSKLNVKKLKSMSDKQHNVDGKKYHNIDKLFQFFFQRIKISKKVMCVVM